jgi:S-(hydroxymethyl)glutathione dehydrogenase / alcohol dehydrogenase
MARVAQALVFRDLEHAPALEPVTIDDPGPGEVLVQIQASGVCGSDLHVLHGRSNVSFPPLIPGHEGAGVVAAVGAGVTAWAEGDRVVVAMSIPCRSCARCTSGDLVACEGSDRLIRIRGLMPDGTTRVRSGDDDVFPFVGCGTLAEYVVVPERQLVAVPDDVPIEVAAISACGVLTGTGAAWNIAKVQPGQSILVVGCGGVGLSIIQGCRVAGAGRIIAVDTNPAKRSMATAVGATDVVDPGATPLRDAVHALVPGGVEIAFEAVGHAPLVTEVFECTRTGGTCVAAAVYGPGATISVPAASLFWSRRLVGCVGGDSLAHRDLPRIFQLYRTGRLDLDVLVGARVPLALVDDAIAIAERGDVARAVVMMP